MREYERDLSGVIVQGLRKTRRPQEDSLVECFNAVPTPAGVKAYIRPGLPFVDCVEVDRGSEF